MDALPLEIKENICSFLSPSHLKPLRLVSKEFASAAILYFIPRIFLFNHPDSCIEMNAILRHPEIPKYINTLIVDPAFVQSFDNFDDWVEDYELRKGRHSKTELEEKRKIYNTLRINQESGEIGRSMASVVRTAFSNCRNLKNFILATFHPPNVLRKRNDIFHGLRLDYSRHGSGTGPTSHLPLGEVVAESLQTITLNNIEINNWDCGIMRNLRHLRVSLRGCRNRPNSQFNAMVHSATHLETLWIGFPWMPDGLYSPDSLLRGIRLKKLHECLLSYVSVSEDELVDFLLHHTQSLRTFGIGGTRLHEGSWPSLFRRLSCQMAVLKQFAPETLLLAHESEYTGSYMVAVKKFVLHGGPEPVETFLEDFPHDYENGPRIIHHVQEGLWKDYDRTTNPYF
ncbi:hypothetical protein D6C87_01876 [Aureobasidium pullulans]|uniref:F-box domain-containing protein n=1 Tax=Aureobasidium pullulans TaxID=5580 RepID=A0AB38LTQ7_AURPU|nr:hypothetical protein D6C94_06823 [Aureobasidium pullulans]THZ46893.1 hypothetical protein D6C87_01876 [Aureobasidium pullulans]